MNSWKSIATGFLGSLCARDLESLDKVLEEEFIWVAECGFFTLRQRAANSKGEFLEYLDVAYESCTDLKVRLVNVSYNNKWVAVEGILEYTSLGRTGVYETVDRRNVQTFMMSTQVSDYGKISSVRIYC